MTVLVVSSWHQRPDLLVDQIDSYNRAFDGDLIHWININVNFKEKFYLEMQKKNIDFSKFTNVYFAQSNSNTAWGLIAHAYLRGVLENIMNGRNFDYVYFHTASDLMIKGGINRYIKDYDIGFGRAVDYKYSILSSGDHDVVDVIDPYLPFREAMKCDRKFLGFLKSVDAKIVKKSRAEGCFFRKDIFFEIMYPLLCHYSLDDMENLPMAYPIEEYLWSICVEKFVARHNVRRARHVIMTSRNEKQRASIEDMAEVLANPNLFGIKRFGGLLDDPVRVHARQLLLSPPSP